MIAAFSIGVAVLAIPSRLVTSSRLAAAAGAVFALATFGGYLLSVWIGLFGFTEVRTGAGIAAGLVEVAAFVVLAALGPKVRTATSQPIKGTHDDQPNHSNRMTTSHPAASEPWRQQFDQGGASCPDLSTWAHRRNINMKAELSRPDSTTRSLLEKS